MAFSWIHIGLRTWISDHILALSVGTCSYYSTYMAVCLKKVAEVRARVRNCIPQILCDVIYMLDKLSCQKGPKYA